MHIGAHGARPAAAADERTVEHGIAGIETCGALGIGKYNKRANCTRSRIAAVLACEAGPGGPKKQGQQPGARDEESVRLHVVYPPTTIVVVLGITRSSLDGRGGGGLQQCGRHTRLLRR